MNWTKVIHGIYGVLFAAVAIWAGMFFLQMQRELSALKAQEAENRSRLAAAEAKLKSQREYLERLQNDPAMVERIIRRKLGYAKPEEFVFRFDDLAEK